jgi:hypothetical protein
MVKVYFKFSVGPPVEIATFEHEYLYNACATVLAEEADEAGAVLIESIDPDGNSR